MRKYSSYEHSNIDLFGEFPTDWEVKKLKYCSEINRLSLTEDTDPNYEIQYIDIGNVNINGLVNPPLKMLFRDAPSRARRVVHNGDTIVSTVRTYLMAIAYINLESENIIASTGFAVLTPTREVLPQYLYYLLISPRVIDIINSLSKGVSYPAIDSVDLANILLFFPDKVSEQKEIINYLDMKTQKIDYLILKKQKLINLLLEERTAIINQAVTKGIDPNVEMKNSGIEWLGKIPAHWEVKRFKYCATIANGQVDPKDPNYLNMPLIAPNHIESGTGKLLSIETVLEQGAESGKYLYDIGNILYSKIRPNLKKACIPQFVGLCSADMYPIRIKRDLRPEFLLNFLLSEAFTNFAIERSMRVAMPKINREDLNNCNLVLPPLSEQDNIIQYIKDELGKLDEVAAKAEREIELIKEYRTTLISEVVTGKIDVRDEVVSWT